MKNALLILTMAFACTTANADKLSSALADQRIALLDLNLSTCKNKVTVEGGEGKYTCSDLKQHEIEYFRKGSFRTLQTHPKVQAMFAQWLAALDAVGTKREEAERLKYEDLANQVRIL